MPPAGCSRWQAWPTASGRAEPWRSRALIAVGAERELAGIYRRRLAQRGAEGDDGAEALLQHLIAAIESLADLSQRGATLP